MKYPVKVTIELVKKTKVNGIISIHTYDAVTTAAGRKLPGADTIRIDIVIETIPEKTIITPLYACKLLIQYLHEIMTEDLPISEVDIRAPDYIVNMIHKGLKIYD